MSNIEVYVRMRPFSEREISKDMNNSKLLLQPYSGEIKVKNQQSDQAKFFSFDGVFDQWTTQQQIFQKCNIDSMVHKVIQGYNSTILVYGQTGAGKTYTMEGNLDISSEKTKGSSQPGSAQTIGIVPRVLKSLFDKIQNQNTRQYKVSLSFIQIYKEKIYDLFNVKSQKLSNGLRLRWNKIQQFIVEKVRIKPCLTTQEAMKAYHKGAANKIMGKHKMNLSSSRSHSILTIKVQSYKNEDPENTLTSKFCLVDLAGSQKQELTGTIGKHFKESVQINKSLFTLRQVITALVDHSRGFKDFVEDDHYIPYRDSKLTCLLKQSFGGNNYTTMIACLNPGDAYLDESIQTLSYAAMTNKIKNIPMKGLDQRIIQINRLKQQLHNTTDQLMKANKHIKVLTTIVQQKNFIIQQFKSGNSSSLITPKINGSGKEGDSVSLEDLQQKHQNQIKLIQTSLESNPNNEKLQILNPKQTLIKRTNEEVFESLSMVKQLINSNMIFRQNNQELTRSLAKKQKQLYELMRENQRLRERWDIFAIQFSEQQGVDLGNPPLSRSGQVVNHSTTERLQPIYEVRRKRLQSLDSGSKSKQEMNFSYNQFINSRYRMKSNPKRSKMKKYSIM